jgi:uncharacterized membrane protein SirB2
MSLQFYKLLHIIGILLTFSALGGVFVYAGNGGNKEGNSLRKVIAISHGVGLVLLLVSGFGMLAKLGLSFPMWVVPKLVIWLALGAAIALGYRKPEKAVLLWTGSVALGSIAALIGLGF